MQSRRAPERTLTEDLGRLLARARRAVWNSAAKRLARRDESVFAWQLLNHVRRKGGASQRELADSTAQHPAGVCRTLEELEAEGLVSRERDPADRRKIRVRVTAKGEAHFVKVQPEVLTAIDEALGPLSRKERLQLRALLEKIVVEVD